jgi:hypothetical protein
MSYNMMISYDIYDCFTMEHFRLRQRMTLTTKMYCSRLYINLREKKWQILTCFSRHSTLRLRIFFIELALTLFFKRQHRKLSWLDKDSDKDQSQFDELFN